MTASGDEAGLFSNTSIPISGESTKVHATSTGGGQGVISGKGNGVLDPKGTATRAEVSQIVTNYDTKIG